jgi:hypothetical protein
MVDAAREPRPGDLFAAIRGAREVLTVVAEGWSRPADAGRRSGVVVGVVRLYHAAQRYELEAGEWAAIAATLPGDADHDAVRRDLEDLLTGYRRAAPVRIGPPVQGDEVQARRRLLRAAEELLAATGPFPAPPSAVIREARRIRESESEALRRLSPTVPKRRGRKPVDAFRRGLVDAVLEIFEQHGGGVTRWQDSPAVRFLVAVTRRRLREDGQAGLTIDSARAEIGRFIASAP